MSKKISSLVSETVDLAEDLDKDFKKAILRQSKKKRTKNLAKKINKLSKSEKDNYGKKLRKVTKKRQSIKKKQMKQMKQKRTKMLKKSGGKKRIKSGGWADASAAAGKVGAVVVTAAALGYFVYWTGIIGDIQGESGHWFAGDEVPHVGDGT